MNNTVTEINSEIEKICEKEASPYNVASIVHPEDLIFQFCVNHDCFDSVDKAIRYYFRQSSESAEKLAALINVYCHQDNKPIKLLEFASGFGAVTRHLINTLPDIEVTACDIHDKAISFIKNKLSVNAKLSSNIPESLSFTEQFDVVFALSFFSHMPKTTWSRWLLSLVNQVKENGILIFTTQGEISRKNFSNPIVDEDGFWFKAISEQRDLDTNEYGMTVTLEKYVIDEIEKINSVECIYYQEAYWWEHQDVYVLRKIKS